MVDFKAVERIVLQVPTDLQALDEVLGKFNAINLVAMPKKDWLQCQLALAEGFTNAVRHAHKSLPIETPITIQFTRFPSALEIRIWDYGPPFDLCSCIDRLSQHTDNWSGGQRGVLILESVADYLSYDRTEDHRNCLVILKSFAHTDSLNPMKTPIVSAEWLLEHLKHPDLVVIDCRFSLPDPQWGEQQYQESHIDSAYYLHLDRDLSSPITHHGGRHPLPTPEKFAAKMAELGIIQGQTWVVAYDSSYFAFASRLWWLLRYFGHDRVAVLDGGWQNWIAQSYPTSKTTLKSKLGQFTAHPNPQWIVDIETVKATQNDPNTFLIDSREAERYRGEKEPIDPIAGHIPTAINQFWREVINEQGYIKSIDWHKSHWQPYPPDKEMIIYCGSGVTACVNLLSLELAGRKNAKLYVGGWSDWCTYLT